MSTEKRNPRSIGLDKMSAKEIVRLMNEEERIVFRCVSQAEDAIAFAAGKAAEAYQRGGRVIYVGAGTSGRIAIVDAAEMPPTFGVPEDRFIAIQAEEVFVGENPDDAEDDEHLAIQALNDLLVNRDDIVIVVAASGKTPFALAAARHANQKGIWTCGIVNAPNAPLIEEVDHAIVLDTGPEVLTGCTRLKAGTAQKMVLNRISTIAMVLSGKVIENLMVDVKAITQKQKERCVKIVYELATVTEEEAQRLLEANDWNVRTVLDVVRSSTGATR